MKPEKDDEREQFPEIPHAAEQKRQKAGGDIAQKSAEPKIFGERQHDRETREHVCRDRHKRHVHAQRQHDDGERARHRGKRDAERMIFHKLTLRGHCFSPHTVRNPER